MESRSWGTSSLLCHVYWVDWAASPLSPPLNITFLRATHVQKLSACMSIAGQWHIAPLLRAYGTDCLYNSGSTFSVGCMQAPHVFNCSPIVRHLGLLKTLYLQSAWIASGAMFNPLNAKLYGSVSGTGWLFRKALKSPTASQLTQKLILLNCVEGGLKCMALLDFL